MRYQGFILTSLTLVVAGIYFFVSAPPLLPEAAPVDVGVVPIERVFETVSGENDIVRALYTQEIVTKGTAAGLAFGETWKDEGVDAGPLPALFLREAASHLQTGPLPLGLFLGSDFPISPSNHFAGSQLEVFARIRATRMPEYFYAEDTGRHTAMFPDVAGVQGCVTCHNEHEQSPKTDWALNDVMGATTWTYPKASVTHDEYLQIVAAVRASFRAAYTAYLEKAATFEAPPPVGEQWPEEGYFIPSADVFMAEFENRASARSMGRILEAGESDVAGQSEGEGGGEGEG